MSGYREAPRGVHWTGESLVASPRPSSAMASRPSNPAIMNATFALLRRLWTGPTTPIASQDRCAAGAGDRRFRDDSRAAVGRGVGHGHCHHRAPPTLACRRKHHSLVKAADWLLDRQVIAPGDWRVRNPATAPGGWAFEFRNDFYPDVDDTAFVLMALLNVNHPDPIRVMPRSSVGSPGCSVCRTTMADGARSIGTTIRQS